MPLCIATSTLWYTVSQRKGPNPLYRSFGQQEQKSLNSTDFCLKVLPHHVILSRKYVSAVWQIGNYAKDQPQRDKAGRRLAGEKKNPFSFIQIGSLLFLFNMDPYWTKRINCPSNYRGHPGCESYAQYINELNRYTGGLIPISVLSVFFCLFLI